jgi:hypothetical protein
VPPHHTGPDGAVRVGPLPPGDFAIEVTHPDAVRMEGAAPRLGGLDEPLVVRLPRGHAIGGKVVWPDGTPAAGADVDVVAYDEEDVDWQVGGQSSDADGRFLVRGIPGVGKVAIHASARRDGERFRVIGEGERDRHRHVLVLEAEAPREIPRSWARVVDPAGRPIPSARAHVVSVWKNVLRRNEREVAGGEVSMQIPGERTRWWLEVFGARSRDAALGPVLVGPFTGARDELLVTLPGEVSIEGVVRDPDGNPVADVRLEARPRWPGLPKDREPPVHATGTSGKDGRFRIGGLAEVEYDLTARAPVPFTAPLDEVVVRGGRTGIVFRVVRAAEPVITVLGPGGEPLAGMQVVVLAPTGRWLFGGPTGAKGRVRPGRLPTGTAFRLNAWDPSDPPRYCTAETRDWRADDRTVRLAAAFSILGQVEVVDDTPLREVRVETKRLPDGDRERHHVEADGSFRAHRLPAGTYAVRAVRREDPPGARREGRVVVRAGERSVRLTLLPR